MLSDDELLDAWRGGDKSSGKLLFQRHYGAVDHFFRNKVGVDAGDLAQKTFLGCLESMDRYERRGNFRAWLLGIAYRQLYKHYRSRASERARIDFRSVSAHDLDPTPSSVVAKSEEERLLFQALRMIPLDMQVVLELHYWEQMTHVEVAHALELPLGTVKSRIRAARVELRKRLGSLTDSPKQLEDSLANLDAWAQQLRGMVLGEI